MDFLAQMPTPQARGDWAAFYAVLALMVTNVGRWISEWRKDRSESKTRAEREKVEDKLEEARQHATDRIANSNEAQLVVLGKIETKLAEAHVLSRSRHEHVSGGLTAIQVSQGVMNEKLNSTCKGTCNLREPMIKPKNVFDKPASFP